MTEDFRASQAPPGPADTEYTTAGLSWVAFAQAARDLADQVAALLDSRDRMQLTSPCDSVLAAAKELRDRAVVFDYEHPMRVKSGNPLDQYISYPSIREDPASDRLIQQWEYAIERPWRATSQSRLPKGLEDPLATAAELDQWCKEHLRSGGYPTVSSRLTRHTAETEAESIARHRRFLEQQDGNISPLEYNAQVAREAHQQKASSALLPNFVASMDAIPDNDQEYHPAHTFWSHIVRNTVKRQPALAEFITGAECVRATGAQVVIGHSDPKKARVLNALTGTFAEAMTETIGLGDLWIYVVNPDTMKLIAAQDEERKAEAKKKRKSDFVED